MNGAGNTFTNRKVEITRKTNETNVFIKIDLDGRGNADNNTGVGFLNHMLDLFAKHGHFDLEVSCEGDLQVDEHHTIEDVGITLGQAFRKALGEKMHIARFGHAYVTMDETLARSVVDLSGRFYLHFESSFNRERVGDFPCEMVKHFWYAFAEHTQCNLHIDVLHGENAHHQIESIFKSAARALKMAVDRNEAYSAVPSTKGTL